MNGVSMDPGLMGLSAQQQQLNSLDAQARDKMDMNYGRCLTNCKVDTKDLHDCKYEASRMFA